MRMVARSPAKKSGHLPRRVLALERDEAKWGHYELLSTRSASDMDGEVSLEVKLREGDKNPKLLTRETARLPPS